MRLFDRLESAAGAAASHPDGIHRRRLLELEGAVLLHLEMAIKHDPDMAKTWLKRLRDGTWRPTPFAFALSLVVAGTERLEQHIIAALRACLLKASNDAAKRAAAPWLPADNRGSGSAAQASIEEALLTCARNAGHGQGTVVVQPLVTLAVSLLEAEGTAGEKTLFHSTAAGSSKDQEASAAGDLGIRVLVEIFASHKECRKDVLALCSGRLAGASEGVAAPYVRLIAELVRQHPALVESHLPEVRAALENLAALPPGAAIALLLALWPLCRARKDIADYVIMLLRKAMFSRELGSRLLAARGFLFIITEELIHSGAAAGGIAADAAGPSASQAIPALSQMDALAGGSGGATLLHELMGFLRRCLAQQPEVRTVVYDSLPALVSADPAVVEAVAELLLPHVASFCEHDEGMAPLKLEACARATPDGDVRVAEPLHRLLACVRCVIRSDPGAPPTDSEDEEEEGEGKASLMQDDAAAPALRRLFASLRSRLASCPLEDFNFDQSTVFSSNEAQGALNQAYAHMLLGCYEVMMEDVVSDIDGRGGAAPGPERSEALAEELLTLFQQHRRLSALATEGMKGSAKGKRMEGLTQAVGAGRAAGGGGGGGNGNKSQTASTLGPLDQRAPMMSVHCLGRLLEAIVEDGLVPGGHHLQGADQQSAHVRLARDVAVQTFIMTGCLRILQSSQRSTLHSQAHALSALTNSTAGGGEGAGPREESAAAGSVSDAVRALFGVPDRQALAGPLFRAAQTTVLACARQHAPAAAGGKKKKDPTVGLMQAAVAALDQLLSSSGTTLDGLAGLLQHVALPAASTATAAALPPVNDGNRNNSDLSTVAARLPHFKQLLDVLVEHACAKEIVSITRCLQTLCSAVPPEFAAAMASWLDAACSNAPEALSHQAPAVKALITLLLKCHEAAGNDGDLAALSRLGADLVECVDAAGAGENNNIATLVFSAPASSPLLSSKSLNAVMLACAAHIDSALGPLDWALLRLKPNGAAEQGAFQEDGESDSSVAGALVQGHVRVQWETATFKRLRGLANAAAAIAKVRVGAPGEALAKSLTKLYRTMGSAAKTQIAGRGQTQLPPGRPFQDLSAAVNAVLTPAVYELKGELQLTTNAAMEKEDEEEEAEEAENEGGNDEAKKEKAKGKAKRAAAVRKAQKDAKVLPGLIFQVEEWEKHLIKVSKVGKINLMLNAKRATNWDFRIKGDQGASKRPRVEITQQVAGDAAEEEEEEEEEVLEEMDEEREIDDEEDIDEGEAEKNVAARRAMGTSHDGGTGGGTRGYNPVAVEDAFDDEDNADGFYNV